jgi:hypothetical protein
VEREDKQLLVSRSAWDSLSETHMHDGAYFHACAKNLWRKQTCSLASHLVDVSAHFFNCKAEEGKKKERKKQKKQKKQKQKKQPSLQLRCRLELQLGCHGCHGTTFVLRYATPKVSNFCQNKLSLTPAVMHLTGIPTGVFCTSSPGM